VVGVGGMSDIEIALRMFWKLTPPAAFCAVGTWLIVWLYERFFDRF
jgi:hypothetical protein